MAKATAALDEWAHETLLSCKLPSGRKVKYQLPDLQSYIARGYIPNPLAGIAVKVEYEGITVSDYETMDESSRKDLFDLMCFVVASGLKDPDLFAELGETAAVEWVASQMPPDDRTWLWMRAMHIDLAKAYDAGQAVVRSLQDLAPFREGQERAPDAADGQGDGKGT